MHTSASFFAVSRLDIGCRIWVDFSLMVYLKIDFASDTFCDLDHTAHDYTASNELAIMRQGWETHPHLHRDASGI